MRGPRWTASDDALLAKLRSDGLAGVQIAQRLGRGHSAVKARVQRLDLTRLYRRRPPAQKTKLQPEKKAAWDTRPCMCCDSPFKSQGNHNRLCGKCRRLDAGIEPVNILNP